MSRLTAAAIVLLLWLAPGSASAQSDCYPYCDFTHYYGPQDFTWVRPGLWAYPACGPSGYCSPHLVSSRRFVGRVTVRSLGRPVRPRY